MSIPRDTYVEVPAYTDTKGNRHPAAKDKFTNAINVGGPSLLVATVEQLTGLQVEHYVSVDLAGFRQITDAVGGVTVCLKQSSFSSNDQNDAGTATVHVSNTNDPFSGWHGGPGTLHLNGEQALAFVRQRHGLPEGDINRIERQQQFLGSVFRSATATRNLLDPARATSLLFSVRDALSLDQNTSSSDLEALAERLKGTTTSHSQPPFGDPGRADPRGLAAPSGATIVSAVRRRAAGRLFWLVVALLPPVFYLAVANDVVLGTSAVIIEMVVFAGIRLALRPSPAASVVARAGAS